MLNNFLFCDVFVETIHVSLSHKELVLSQRNWTTLGNIYNNPRTGTVHEQCNTQGRRSTNKEHRCNLAGQGQQKQLAPVGASSSNMGSIMSADTHIGLSENFQQRQ